MKAKIRRKTQGWTFNKDGVSQGFIHYFLACREQTRLVYKELWTSHYEPLFREFGSAFHWLLAEIYGKYKSPQLPTVKRMINQYDVLWRKENPRPNQARLNQQELVYGLCEKVLPAYLKRYDGDLTTGKYKMGYNVIRPVKWIASETTWKQKHIVPIPKLGYLGEVIPKSFEVFIRGKFDQVFEDKKGKLWLFETKCLSVINEDEIMQLLPEDIQCLLYLLAIKLIYKKKPAGVLYNIVRRPGLRQGKDETLKGLLARVEKDINTPNRQNHYFKRIEMAIDWSEIEIWQEKFLNPILMEIRDWDKGNACHWQNPDALTSRYGRCTMFDMLVKKDRTRYYRRKFVFNELQDNI